MTSTIAWIVPVCPLVSFLLIAFGARKSRALSAALGILAIGIGFVLSLLILFEVMGGARVNVSVPWIPIPATPGGVPAGQLGQFMSPLGAGMPGSLSALPLGFQVDPLTAIMLVVVTSVSFLVQVYSLGYM